MPLVKFLEDEDSKWEKADELKETSGELIDAIKKDSQSAFTTDMIKDRLGMCAQCSNCSYCSTEFGNVTAWCYHFEAKLSGRDKMVSCTAFSQKGQMNLATMVALAYLIDIPKDKPGFLPEREKNDKRTDSETSPDSVEQTSE